MPDRSRNDREAEKDSVREAVGRPIPKAEAEQVAARVADAERHRKRPVDLNRLAASIVSDATDETPDPDEGKDPAAVALGRRGGLKGGKARAAKLTAEQRSEIAKKAAESRWGKRG